ncbi:MAG: endolytic transglycosylase MltG [Balneolaceae bacterium]
MDLNKFISLTKSELISTLLLFVLITALVLSSRLVRLTGSAMEFENSTEIILSAPGGLNSLISELQENEINYNEDELEWAANILGWKNLRRGRYVFEGNYSYNSLLSKLAKGIQDPVSVVILPGIVPQILADNLADKLNFNSQDFMNALTDSAYLSEKNLRTEELFGRMYPETYLIYWTSSPKEVLNKVTREFNKSVTEILQQQADEVGISIDDALTMASIVEWEAKVEEEKPIISGLYWNRIDRGMRLQADPTVNFAVGERRRLLFEDYKLDHEFNTYLKKGLPPGPVTNPSISSIRAALNPEEHDYLYMVANPKGGHFFTRTFEEHIEESKKWRQWLQQQYRIKRQRESEAANNSETR